MLTQEQKVALEGLVDSSSLANVLAALAEIAREKAEHIRSNWQDEPGAAHWEYAARTIDRATGKVTV